MRARLGGVHSLRTPSRQRSRQDEEPGPPALVTVGKGGADAPGDVRGFAIARGRTRAISVTCAESGITGPPRGAGSWLAASEPDRTARPAEPPHANRVEATRHHREPSTAAVIG